MFRRYAAAVAAVIPLTLMITVPASAAPVVITNTTQFTDTAGAGVPASQGFPARHEAR